MVVTGFDPEVARQYGYSTVQPENRVGGNCGSSYLYLSGVPHGLTISTGFDLNTPAISYAWTVDVYGPTGYQRQWSGGLAFRKHWNPTTNLTKTGLKPGSYTGLVTSPAYAVLETGVVCQSAHPTDTKPVF